MEKCVFAFAVRPLCLHGWGVCVTVVYIILKKGKVHFSRDSQIKVFPIYTPTILQTCSLAQEWLCSSQTMCGVVQEI